MPSHHDILDEQVCSGDLKHCSHCGVYWVPAKTTHECLRQNKAALAAVIGKWTLVHREHPSDNMMYHPGTIAAILQDLNKL